jgi:hypothetical protein
MALAASDISRNGDVIPRARNRTITSAREPAMTPLIDGHTRFEAQPEHEHGHCDRGEDDSAELDLEE